MDGQYVRHFFEIPLAYISDTSTAYLGYMQSASVHVGRLVSHTVRIVFTLSEPQHFTELKLHSFFSTTYVAEIYQSVHDFEAPKTPTTVSPHEADPATRAGSRAMFLQAVFSFACSIILPFLTASLIPSNLSSANGTNARKVRPSTDEDVGFMRRNRLAWSESILDKILNSRFMPTLPFPWLDLSLLWMISHIFFAILMFGTYFVGRVWSATLIITLLGFCCKS